MVSVFTLYMKLHRTKPLTRHPGSRNPKPVHKPTEPDAASFDRFPSPKP